MAKFQGKNRQDIRKQFFERLKYSRQAFGSTVIGGLNANKTVKDFNFAERAMYGRIDKSHNPIIANPATLKLISSKIKQRRQTKAINFVVDAFEQLVLEMSRASFSGKLEPEDPYLSKLQAYMGFVDPFSNYKSYNDKLGDIFINKYLTREREEKIEDFSSFINLFSSFILEISNSLPITLNSFVTSGFSGLANTGLAIHVSDLDASDDSIKEQFINSPNFSFFKLAAEKHGFSINKNVPWILVADIASPSMQKYSRNYGLDSEDAILSGYFLKTYQRDIQNLQKLFFRTYNKFITRNPRNIKIDGFGIRQGACRVPISVSEFDEKYPDRNWVDMYIDIRYIEQNKPGSLARLREIKRNANSIQSVEGTAAMQNYVNLSIVGFDNYAGSFAKVVEKLNFSQTGTKTKPTY